MTPSKYNSLLMQQIGDYLEGNTELSPQLLNLLTAISNSYDYYDKSLHQAVERVIQRTDQLIASTSQAYSFLDNINKGFIMCDTSGEVVLTNNSLRHILSLKSNPNDRSVSGDKANTSITIDYLDSLFNPDFELKKYVIGCIKDSKVIERDDITFGKGILHLYLTPLLNNEGKDNQQLFGVVILIEDVTEQKLLDRSKDEFLSIASHELRTPLTAIRGNAALIQKYYSAQITDKDMKEMVDDIHESSIRLIGIVNDFLDVAAIEQGKIKMIPEQFNLRLVIDDVSRELEELFKANGLYLKCDPSIDEQPSVWADKQRTKQVIINLVGNAIKFTGEGGITLSAFNDEHFVYVDVTDTGKGMSEENQKLLFRKFQQAGSNLLTRDTTKGTGLGLYISKQIIELSGGKIGLKSSKPDVGSVFEFSLPRQKPVETSQSGI
jgi:two-component system, OmpR family, sensor histidine kinase ResE